MGSIKIIDRINITEDGLKHSRLGSDVFLHQGDIDGACAVYSLMMDLVIIDAINIRDTDLGAQDGKDQREAKQRLFKELTAGKYGLLRDGFRFAGDKDGNDLETILKRTYSKFVTTTYAKTDVVNFVKEAIDKNLPCIVGVDYKNGGGHAMCAVGYESNAKEIVTKIFCLDPGANKPLNSYWNSVVLIDTDPKARKYNDYYVSSGVVALRDALLVEKK